MEATRPRTVVLAGSSAGYAGGPQSRAEQGNRRMGKVYDSITPALRTFMAKQPMFFVATAPLADDGLINLSPKGLDGTFAIVDDHRVAYLDLMGSAGETVAHVRENGRITILFNAFSGPPRIVRLYGQATWHEVGDPTFADLIDLFSYHRGTRSIIDIRVDRIADSCGFGVPAMTLDGQRTQLQSWASKRDRETLLDYKKSHNESLDGLPILNNPNDHIDISG
jgi:pyridoxamine 5'-phosphate oxidase-like protein